MTAGSPFIGLECLQILMEGAHLRSKSAASYGTVKCERSVFGNETRDLTDKVLWLAETWHWNRLDF
jgi:hypothetical protein